MASIADVSTSTYCAACNRKIQSKNPLRILCSICKRWRHLKCTPFVRTDIEPICPNCIDELFPFCHITDDDSYNVAISGHCDNSAIDFNLLSKVKLELSHSFSSATLLTDDDLDADVNYYNTLLNTPSDYCDTATLEKIIQIPCHDNAQSLLHINARSLSKNIDRLVSELNLLPNKPSIIAVTETWAKTDSDIFPIPGYTSILKAREKKVGGGVGLFIQDAIDLKYKLRPDLSLNMPSESLFIQLTNKKHRNTIIGVIYNPPDSDVMQFTKTMEKLTSIISKEHRPCFLLGDYNINLLKHDKHFPTQQFLDTLLASGFYPLINKPTRITENTATLIDNIFTNVHHIDTKSGIWIVDISDHLPIFTALPPNSKKCKTKKVIAKQDFSQENIDKFSHYLCTHDWSILKQFSDVNLMYNSFIATTQIYYNKAFPVKTKIISTAVNHLPWITPAIKKSITKKNSLYKAYLTQHSAESLKTYKAYRNKLTAVLRKAEKQYYMAKLEHVKDNLGKTWKILNSIISRTSRKDTIPEIVHNSKIINNANEIANKFNSFFANVGPNLAKKIPQATCNFSDFLPAGILDSIFLKPTDENEICQVTGLLKNSYSKGFDELSTVILKNCIGELCQPLCMIFNKSIEDGVVPTGLKIAKVIPIYKTEDRKLVSNYRPISVLPAFSKIIERLMYNRLINFLNKHDILSPNQYGFRKNLSTSMALLDLVDKLSSSIDNNEITVGIFIDLAKAFDTVNHNILLSKLYHYGIRGTAYNWFKSYLSNRSQYVYVNNVKSDSLPVTCGVPQGSILGPLLFLVYINDLNFVSKILTLLMFADDTNIFISGKNLQDIISLTNTELEKINTWFSANLLSLNVKKTNYILFGHKKMPDVDIFINNQNVIRVNQTKFLGVIIQHNLKWHAHIQLIQNKISKTIGILNKIKNILSTPHLRLLYQSLIEPYLMYSCMVWATPDRSTLLEVLHRLQKRAARIIVYAKHRDHSKPFFSKLNILSIYDLCLTQILHFVYKSLNSLLPSRYNNYFISLKESHLHYTRGSKHNLFVSRAAKICRINCLSIRGPKFWNSLPDTLKTAPSFAIFKTYLKTYLFNCYICT